MTTDFVTRIMMKTKSWHPTLKLSYQAIGRTLSLHIFCVDQSFYTADLLVEPGLKSPIRINLVDPESETLIIRLPQPK
ncbi:hypothetical protein TNCV_3301041 [Trichonephila clavipes]|nr:hypothetical protein TNCV_3301041 [Trichonephila clavipes]